MSGFFKSWIASTVKKEVEKLLAKDPKVLRDGIADFVREIPPEAIRATLQSVLDNWPLIVGALDASPVTTPSQPPKKRKSDPSSN